MMDKTILVNEQLDPKRFLQSSLRAIVRAEVEGRVPRRFTEGGQSVWKVFRNELTAADLVALAVQDAGVTMPVPFDPGQWWPEWPDWTPLQQSPAEAEQWIDDALAAVEQSRDSYLRHQAALLALELPPDEKVAKLPTPAPHETWLELPGTAGWIAYTLVSRPEANLYYWENFDIRCVTWPEMVFAGLIAWELGAPPRTELPIRLDDADLSVTLKAGQTYHAVVGQRERHGHRDLRVLHQGGEHPSWI